MPPAPAPANCPEVGPSAKVLAGIIAKPASSLANAALPPRPEAAARAVKVTVIRTGCDRMRFSSG